ncbi:hypothetical protein AAII07_23040 [Microvirga sp. 0TCS3.31]
MDHSFISLRLNTRRGPAVNAPVSFPEGRPAQAGTLFVITGLVPVIPID